MNKNSDCFKEPYSHTTGKTISNQQEKEKSSSQFLNNKTIKVDNINSIITGNFVDAKDRNIEIEMQNLLKSSSKFNK
jgi:hypothetical protein